MPFLIHGGEALYANLIPFFERLEDQMQYNTDTKLSVTEIWSSSFLVKWK